MSDSTQAAPMITPEEIERFKAIKLTTKRFGSPANSAEKRSRTAWEAKKAARQATNQ